MSANPHRPISRKKPPAQFYRRFREPIEAMLRFRCMASFAPAVVRDRPHRGLLHRCHPRRNGMWATKKASVAAGLFTNVSGFGIAHIVGSYTPTHEAWMGAARRQAACMRL
jgi:hypothetical protein